MKKGYKNMCAGSSGSPHYQMIFYPLGETHFQKRRFAGYLLVNREISPAVRGL
jgi:hypothetical protein